MERGCCGEVFLADIQVGDHVMARGATQNNVFIPKGVMVETRTVETDAGNERAIWRPAPRWINNGST